MALILAGFGDSGLEPHQESIGLGHTWEKFFLCLKLRRVDTATAAAQPHRVLQVEHLVVDDVVQNIARDGGMIEDSADDDGVVCWVVVAEYATGFRLAPTHSRTRHQAIKETGVQ